MALLSVAQLVDRTAPPTENQVALWQRRVRLWSDAGILTTVGPHEGTGKHRRYSDSVVYLAAVLLRISDFVTETSTLKRIAISIQASLKGRNFSRMWRDAINGKRGTCYISFSLRADYYPEIYVVYD